MKRAFSIALIVFIVFYCEFILFSVFGRFFKPNLLLLLVIFFNISRGTEYSIFVAILAGLLKDGFSASEFGAYFISFVVCGYLVTMLRKYFYQVDSGHLRIIVAGVMSLLHAGLVYSLGYAPQMIDFDQALIFVILPEVVATTLVAAFVFDKLKICALKFSV